MTPKDPGQDKSNFCKAVDRQGVPATRTSPDATVAGGPSVPRKTLFQVFWVLFRKNRLAVAGMMIFFVFFILAVCGVVLTTGKEPVLDPALVRLQEKLRPPLSQADISTLKTDEMPFMGRYLLGTDELGRDVFARMLQGAWVSLTVGFVAVGIAVVIGIVLGGVAGYYGNAGIMTKHALGVSLMIWAAAGLVIGNWAWIAVPVAVFALVTAVDRTPERVMGKPSPLRRLIRARLITVDGLVTGLIDIMLCFPSFFLILTVVALLPSSIYNIMAIIGLTSWMGAARFVRAEFLALREMDFVTAGRALGMSDFRIIFRHMIPNAVAPVLVSATIGIASAILTEAGLSFLGFGVPPPHATWGNILSNGKNYLFDAPWLTFVPGVAILVVVLAFNLFGEGLRDSLNPRLRERV
jgi:peptide/nickel transport system permease protein